MKLTLLNLNYLTKMLLKYQLMKPKIKNLNPKEKNGMEVPMNLEVTLTKVIMMEPTDQMEKSWLKM